MLFAAGLLVLLTAGILTVGAYWPFGTRADPGIITASGILEGDEITISTKVPGRVQTVAVGHGEQVASGTLLAALDSTELTTRKEQAEAQLAISRSEQARVGALLASLDHQIAAAEAETDAAVRQAKGEVVRAEAALDLAERQLELAADRLRRSAQLYEAGTIQEQAWQEIQTAHAVARAQVRQAEAAREIARAALDRARGASHQVEALRLQGQEARANLDAAAAGEQAARAALKAAETAVADARITAPVAGTLLSRLVNVGELLAPGAPVAVLVDLRELTLKAYLPEAVAGQVHVGDDARIRVDAYLDRWFPATVTYVAQKAQFTPKTVQTTEERTRLVYEVRIRVENQERLLNPGAPADVQIRAERGRPWPAGR